MINKKIYSLALILCLSFLCGCNTANAPTEPASTKTQTDEVIITDEEIGTTEDSEITEEIAITEETASKTTDPEKEPEPDTQDTNDMENKEENTSESRNMKLSLNNTVIVDSNNNPIQLKGVSTHGIGWYPQYVNYDAFKYMRDTWNINCIRLAMYTAEDSGYCTNGDKENLKKIINKGVGYATDLGLYVLIDWHILSDGNPNTHADEAIDFFEEMSSAYSSYDNVLYEICNEPNGDVKWSDIKEYAEKVIPVIRNNDSDALIIVGTPTWSQDVDIAALDPITEYDNILYTIHFYAATHKEDLRNKMKEALDNNLPLFCSEFGICDASGNGTLDIKEADKWIKAMDDASLSYCIWNLSNKDEASALISSDCDKTEDWTYEELSEEAQWYLGVLGSSLSTATIDEPSTDDDNISDNEDTSKNTKAPKDKDTSNKGFTVKASISNTWNDGKSDFAQIDVHLSNKGETKDSWEITIEFANDVKIDQKWNGEYKVKGKTVTISPVDYNKTLKDKDSYDIGFIVKSAKDISIENISYK